MPTARRTRFVPYLRPGVPSGASVLSCFFVFVVVVVNPFLVIPRLVEACMANGATVYHFAGQSLRCANWTLNIKHVTYTYL